MPTVTTFDALLSGYSWNGLEVAGRPVFLTYSFDLAPAPDLTLYFSSAFLATFAAFGSADQAQARLALQAWGDASGVTFFEVPAGRGDIRFGMYDFRTAPPDLSITAGFTFFPLVYDYPEGAVDLALGGDVFIDLGQATFPVLVHEIGHALGLKHPFEDEPILHPAHDNLHNTVMTYSVLGGPATALGTLDLQAAQFLYGRFDADGSQAASWSWDAATHILTQAGGAGSDTLAGVATDDRTRGGAGDDYIFTRAGDDTLAGDDGNDTLAGGAGTDTVTGGLGGDTLDGDEGDDLLSGGAGDDGLWGLQGADTLSGEAGDDFLAGGSGFNRLAGGAGDDVLVVTLGPAAADGGDGYDELWLSPSASGAVFLTYASFGQAGGSYASIESMVLFGSSTGDTLQGGELPDQLVGGSGDDTLSAAVGEDELFGQVGADTLSGGAGVDYLDGGAGDDLIFSGSGADTLEGGVGVDTVDFSDELEGVNLVINSPRFASGTATEQMSGVENLIGSRYADHLLGDTAANRILGGAGADTIGGGDGANYLRGDDGSDSLAGGADFDDLNGNIGDDTVSTGAGDDYCVGGKGSDLLAGGDGHDLVYGNLGGDTCDGGAGADTVRGGQENDSLSGGAGDDFLSGDKGDDTLAGGGGADIFHTFGDASIDRVTDFSLAEGDRVQLDPGTPFTVSQVGADTVINMTGGGQMVLVGVAMNTLTGSWLFGA